MKKKGVSTIAKNITTPNPLNLRGMTKEERDAIARARKQVRQGKTVSLKDFKERLKIR